MLINDISLKGKVAIVTGGGRGIGKAISLAFAEAGASIVAVARTQEEIEETCHEVKALGQQSFAIPTGIIKGITLLALENINIPKPNKNETNGIYFFNIVRHP